MIPEVEKIEDFTFEIGPSKTFGLHPETETVSGKIDQIESLKQAIYLILNTERYEWLIHDWDYGVELGSLVGKPVSYCIPEIDRRVKEALLQDNRIKDVRNFSFDVKKNKVLTKFTVVSIFGDIEEEMEVTI